MMIDLNMNLNNDGAHNSRKVRYVVFPSALLKAAKEGAQLLSDWIYKSIIWYSISMRINIY